jgi:hypothetical protein
MEIFLSIVGLILLVFVAFAIARFVLRLTGRVIGCIITIIVALGILAILLLFVF